MSDWSPRKRLLGLLVIAFVIVQLAVPILQLAQPRPARFGWQMYSALTSLPVVNVETANGTVTPLDLTRVVVRERAEVDFSAALVQYVCDTTDAVAVRIGLGEIEQRVPCR